MPTEDIVDQIGNGLISFVAGRKLDLHDRMQYETTIGAIDCKPDRMIGSV